MPMPSRCKCFAGWKGSRCEEFHFAPVNPNQAGLILPNSESTWGGSVVFRQGQYHMFASELVLNCGLDWWTTNSQVIRAVSDSPLGPYQKVQVVLPTFSHEPNIVQAPSGEIVMFVTALLGTQPKDCRSDTTTSVSPQQHLRGINNTIKPRHSYMLWAPHPQGPWSEPVLVLNSTKWNRDYWERIHGFTECDSNMNGIILPDDSFLGLWRRCETNQLKTIPHTIYASHWRDASSYTPNTDPIFVLGGAGAEDFSNIWTTTTSDMGSAFHVVLHDEQATRCMEGHCSGNGRHAFSLDGKAWRYASRNAYTRHFQYTNATLARVDTRARPHVIMDPTTREPMALSTGVKPTDKSGHVWTLVQPLKRTTTTSHETVLLEDH